MVTVVCKQCGVKFEAKCLRSGNGIRRFCSIACSNAWHVGRPNEKNRGERNGYWHGGRTKTKGYIKIPSTNHPRRDQANRVFEHIIVAETILGRYLTGTETIHHINENRSDNRPDNLFLFSTVGVHTSYHKLVSSGKCDIISMTNIIPGSTGAGPEFIDSLTSSHKSVCIICGTPFLPNKRSVDHGAKYCSIACTHVGKIRIDVRICPACGKEFTVKPSSVAKYCSRKCYANHKRKG